MRPVNKGVAPYSSIKKYGEALPYLEKSLGEYCSYCEFNISHMGEVEHVTSKSKGGDRLNWSNLLLSCKYCNTRKGSHTTSSNIEDYMWPDEMNTAIAFVYDNGIPAVNSSVLMKLDSTGGVLKKAEALFHLVKLDNNSHLSKDKRFQKRMEVFTQAEEHLKTWIRLKNEVGQKGKEDLCKKMLEVIKANTVELAKASGFFSIWMTVFHDEPEILLALIDAFPGTNKQCYDEVGHPKESDVSDKFQTLREST